MRIVCSIGLRAGAEMVQQVLAITASARHELVLIHVIDTGPRHDLAQLSGPLRFGPRASDTRHGQAIAAAEEAAARVSLDEAAGAARALGVEAATRLERGRPEQVLLAVAREVQAALVVVRANDHAEGRPFVGPASMGHVARFVLDHAPCDVLLLRSQ